MELQQIYEVQELLLTLTFESLVYVTRSTFSTNVMDLLTSLGGSVTLFSCAMFRSSWLISQEHSGPIYIQLLKFQSFFFSGKQWADPSLDLSPSPLNCPGTLFLLIQQKINLCAEIKIQKRQIYDQVSGIRSKVARQNTGVKSGRLKIHA